MTGLFCVATVAAGGDAGVPPRLERLLASETVTATKGLQRLRICLQCERSQHNCALVLLDVVELSDFDGDDIVLASEHGREGGHGSRRCTDRDDVADQH